MSTQTQIKSESKRGVIRFFQRRKPGSKFTRQTLLDQVNKMTVNTEADILRSMRKLRAEGLIDYQAYRNKGDAEYQYEVARSKVNPSCG